MTSNAHQSTNISFITLSKTNVSEQAIHCLLTWNSIKKKKKNKKKKKKKKKKRKNLEDRLKHETAFVNMFTLCLLYTVSIFPFANSFDQDRVRQNTDDFLEYFFVKFNFTKRKEKKKRDYNKACKILNPACKESM